MDDAYSTLWYSLCTQLVVFSNLLVHIGALMKNLAILLWSYNSNKKKCDIAQAQMINYPIQNKISLQIEVTHSVLIFQYLTFLIQSIWSQLQKLQEITFWGTEFLWSRGTRQLSTEFVSVVNSVLRSLCMGTQNYTSTGARVREQGTQNYTSTGERVKQDLSGVNLIKLAAEKKPPRNDSLELTHQPWRNKFSKDSGLYIKSENQPFPHYTHLLFKIFPARESIQR